MSRGVLPGTFAAWVRRHVMASAEVTWRRRAGHHWLFLEHHRGAWAAWVTGPYVDTQRVVSCDGVKALRELSLWNDEVAADAARAWASDVDARGLRLRDLFRISLRAEVLR